MATKEEAYVTFIVHCSHCHQRLNPGAADGATTPYQHNNPADCPEGSDVELPTVTISQLEGVFSAPKKAASKKKAK